MSAFKKYYEDADYRDRHLAYQKEKIICPGCNTIVNRASYSSHLKSNKHNDKLRNHDQEISALESEKAEIERIFNKKIRAMKRNQDAELEIIQNRLKIYK